MQSSRLARLLLVAGLLGAALVPALPAGSTAPGRDTVTIGWSTTRRTLDDGRTYFVRAPHCSPAGAARCVRYLSRPRAVVLFLHAAQAKEDRATAVDWLRGLGGIGPGTLFVYGVSDGGSQRWDAGFCCTEEPVDDLGYLVRVVDDLDGPWAVDRDRVGATGFSNGGMLALRAACERPEVFAGVAALSATYVGPCDTGKVEVGQWHGGADPAVPLEGGTVHLLGQDRELPPVASLPQRMKRGSLFWLRVIPRRGHSMTWQNHEQATEWLLQHLAH